MIVLRVNSRVLLSLPSFLSFFLLGGRENVFAAWPPRVGLTNTKICFFQFLTFVFVFVFLFLFPVQSVDRARIVGYVCGYMHGIAIFLNLIFRGRKSFGLRQAYIRSSGGGTFLSACSGFINVVIRLYYFSVVVCLG